MKVIQQLIGYFEERGKLQPRHIDQFISRGYWGLYSSADLHSLEHRVGDSFFFQATGNVQGSLWGTDTYTSDSDLGTACVDAGVLQSGEAGVVKVTMVEPLPLFQASLRHGVASQEWTSSWPGAYQVALVKK